MRDKPAGHLARGSPEQTKKKKKEKKKTVLRKPFTRNFERNFRRSNQEIFSFACCRIIIHITF